MRPIAKDLLAAWLVLLLVTTGFGVARHDGRFAGQPLWELCGDASGDAIAGPTGPVTPHFCLDCLAPALAAFAAPAFSRGALPVQVSAPPASHHDAPDPVFFHGPGIRAPPLRS